MNFSPPLPTPIRQSAPSSSDCQPLSDGVAVRSRLLASLAYDQDETILQLEFRDGTVYQYFQVPRQTYQSLLQADSKGAYFNSHIRNVFRCARLRAR
ncbi:Imidazoleglycerol-phosphate synthase (modular protein) [Candidatus Sulfopaludibacter sp. SbA6]|nr:Imidazoleglycerol-phosphate synthase (modular protein) [Candidatus Sulfopaludibacter sp. SbA6]